MQNSIIHFWPLTIFMIILNFVYSRLSPKVHHHLKYFHSSILFSIFAQIFWKMIHENKAKKIFHKETVKKNHRCPKTANTLNTSFYSFLRLSIPVRLSPLAFSIRKIYQGAPWPKKYRWFVSITRIFSTSSLLPQHAPMLRIEQHFTDAFYSLLSPLRALCRTTAHVGICFCRTSSRK